MFPHETFNILSEAEELTEEYLLELYAIYVDKDIYKKTPENFKADLNFVLNAVQKNSSFFQFVPKELKMSTVFLQDCLYKNPEVLVHYAEEEILPMYSPKSEEVFERLLVLYLVCVNGLLLEHLPKYCNDDEVVYFALKNNGLALEFVSDEFKCNVDVLAWAMKANPSAIWLADPFLHGHPDLMMRLAS
jgi:hypothetical protein